MFLHCTLSNNENTDEISVFGSGTNDAESDHPRRFFIASRSRQIEQQQQQLLRQNQQQRESLERATPSLHAAMPAQAEASDGPCFSIHRIALDGATLIDPRQQQKIVQPWLGQCMDIARITKLVNIISDWYISRGYITSRAFLTEQDLLPGYYI